MLRLRDIILVLTLLGVTASCEHSTTTPPATMDRLEQPPAAKVILVIVDGPRLTETLEDPSHQYVPNTWNTLRPNGTILQNFRNQGETKTMPGHSSMLSGTWQTIANDGTERPTMPTLFEYYRFDTAAPASDAVIVGGKSKLAALSYSTHSSYGAAFGASVHVGFGNDAATFAQLTSLLQNDQPHLVMVSFSDVDLSGHSGVWNNYVGAIAAVDAIIAQLWSFVQSDPFYTGSTYMFVSADHGRHDDQNGGFQAHGDACQGCQRLPFLVLGPDIVIGGEFGNQYLYTQRDMCRTIADILGVPTPYAGGLIMIDIFQSATAIR